MFANTTKTEKSLEDKMGFGKYKEDSVESVLGFDPSYLVWAHDNIDWFKLEPHIYESAVDRAFEEKLNDMDWGVDIYDFMD